MKLQLPRLRADHLPRPRLLEVLIKAVPTHRLTLLSAPAGAGKTTLLAALPAALPAADFAWLSLDAGDDAPAALLLGLAGALERGVPGCGDRVQAALGALAGAPRRVAGVLANALLEAPALPRVLVLDDLHVLTNPAALEVLEVLLERLPPTVHVVAAARHAPPLPLARLRARSELAELRLEDLRFTPDEAEVLLNGRLALGLSPEALVALERRTGGWAAALRLLAAGLERLPTPEARAQSLARTAAPGASTARVPAAQMDAVFALLAEEVLGHEPPQVQDFLLRSAILEELTPGLCEAVTGHARAGPLLQELSRRNLLLSAEEQTPVGNPAMQELGPVYRLHALLSDFLRHRLAQLHPEQVPQLHRRAAAAHPWAVRAVGHLLRAGDVEPAAALLEREAPALFSQGLLETLGTLLEALPGKVRARHPRLLHFLGVHAWSRSDFPRAAALQQAAREGFEAAGDAAGEGEALVQLSILHQTRGDFTRADAMVVQARARPLSPRSRAQLHMGSGFLALGRDAFAEAVTEVQAALDVAEASGDAGALHICAMHLRATFLPAPGAVALLERFRRMCARSSAPVVTASAESHAMVLHLVRAELGEARAAAVRALAASERLGGPPWLMVDTGVLASALLALHGDGAAADRGLAEHALVVEQFEEWRAGMFYVHARVRLAQGRLPEARALAARIGGPAAREWPVAPTARAMAAGALALAEGQVAEAVRHAREAVALQGRTPLSLVFGDARALLARAQLEAGRGAEALHALEAALTAHAALGIPGMLCLEGPGLLPVLRLALERGSRAPGAELLAGALAPLSAGRGVAVPDTGLALTARELEVLRLVAGGLGNQEVATALGVSLPTVKTHVARLLSKLGAASRTEAAARARALHLL
ncbi:helix-turn-helix transcriptional regulator [Pyxidicoccus caerfyrddinensis]|nr:LuxR C-terminal-related transcriptional regulator [Pyxidicoccus caerfyrddinensis]